MPKTLQGFLSHVTDLWGIFTQVELGESHLRLSYITILEQSQWIFVVHANLVNFTYI